MRSLKLKNVNYSLELLLIFVQVPDRLNLIMSETFLNYHDDDDNVRYAMNSKIVAPGQLGFETMILVFRLWTIRSFLISRRNILHNTRHCCTYFVEHFHLKLDGCELRAQQFYFGPLRTFV